MFERHWHEILDSEHPLFSLNFYTSGPLPFPQPSTTAFQSLIPTFFQAFIKNGFLKAYSGAFCWVMGFIGFFRGFST